MNRLFLICITAGSFAATANEINLNAGSSLLVKASTDVKVNCDKSRLPVCALGRDGSGNVTVTMDGAPYKTFYSRNAAIVEIRELKAQGICP